MRPRAGERRERVAHLRARPLAVGVPPLREAPAPVRPEEIRVDVFQDARDPLDLLVVAEGEFASGPQDVPVEEPEAVRRLPSVARDRDAGQERPRILRDDEDVDDSPVRRPGGHRSRLEEAELPEVPLGLLQLRRIVRIPLLEEQEFPDDGRARRHVRPVQRAIEPGGRLLGREDVHGANRDLADAERRALRLLGPEAERDQEDEAEGRRRASRERHIGPFISRGSDPLFALEDSSPHLGLKQEPGLAATALAATRREAPECASAFRRPRPRHR